MRKKKPAENYYKDKIVVAITDAMNFRLMKKSKLDNNNLKETSKYSTDESILILKLTQS